MYGIPNMKLDKYLIERRIQLLRDEGVTFLTDSDIGHSIPLLNLVRDHDAVLLATGSTLARDLDIEGRQGPGVHLLWTSLQPVPKACSILISRTETSFQLTTKMSLSSVVVIRAQTVLPRH